MDELPKRKLLRLEYYDYSQNGYYFVTICTKGKKNIFGKIVSDSISSDTESKQIDPYNENATVTPVGADSISARIIEKTFIEIIDKYDYIKCPIYVIMPNHFHCIIGINHDEKTRREDMESSPTNAKASLSDIIQEFKRYSTIEYIKMVKQKAVPPFDKQIWQRSYYEHIIRNEKEYLEIYKYIYENPVKWELDKYYEE